MTKSIYRREHRLLLELLLAARTKSGLTQGEVAAALGYAQSTLSHIERGSRRLDLIELLDYCRVVKADPRDLLDELLRIEQPDLPAKRRKRPKR